MSEEGQRLEFGDKGPYLFETLTGEPEAMLLEEHEVCLFQFGQIYLPVALDAAKGLAGALSNMSQAAMGPEREGMTPVGLDLDGVMELPLLTGVADESFQYEDIVYLDVFFGETQARLCFSILGAAIIGQVTSQVPEK